MPQECPCECHGHYEAPCTIEGGCGHLHASPAPLQRPQTACQVCRPPLGNARRWRRADDPYRVCHTCLEKLSEDLEDIGARYAKLDPSPGGTGADGTRGAPGFDSKPTGSLHIMTMRDPRSSETAKVWVAADGRVHTESTRPPLSVYGVLESWAFHVAELRDYSERPPYTVGELVTWLDKQLDWVGRQAWVGEFAGRLRTLESQLRPVTGDPSIFIAPCPNTIDEGEHTRECTGRLYAPPEGSDTIRCGACGETWERPDWEWLGKIAKDKREGT